MKTGTIAGKKVCRNLMAASLLTFTTVAAPMSVLAAEKTSGTQAGVDMSTDYPGVTAKAGQTVTFSLDFESLDGESHDVTLSSESIPENWNGYFKSKNGEVTRVHVKGATGTDSTLGDDLATYSLDIPADAEEGTYTLELGASSEEGDEDTVELEVVINEEENGSSELTTSYAEQQGTTGTSFSFDTTIVNNRGIGESFALAAEAPEGWQVSFTPSGESTSVTTIDVDASASQGVTVSITPTETVEKGEYSIPVTAISADDSLSTELTVNITGTYGATLSTPTGNLSADAYTNKATNITLTVTNTGNVDLENLNLTSSAPTGWDVTFSESTIDTLEAGASKEITATVTPGEDAITGDYVTAFVVSNSVVQSEADFRISVKTPTTWGYTAIAIIVVLVIALGLIIKKYGRR